MSERKTILVLGDVMLDTWITTEFQKISRETSVQINQILNTLHSPGGAGNAARICKFLMNSPVILVGVVGTDSSANILKELLEKEGIAAHLIVDPSRTNTSKVRVYQNDESLIRLDHEKLDEISLSIEDEILEDIESNLSNIGAILLSDYGKGFFTDSLVKRILEIAKEAKIPTVADPAQNHVLKFRGCDIIKPNQFEWNSFLDEVSYETEKAIIELNCPFLVITRSNKGIEYYLKGNRSFSEAIQVEPRDITGAGDTVAAVLTCGTALGIEENSLIEIANRVAAEFVSLERTVLPKDINHLLKNFR